MGDVKKVVMPLPLFIGYVSIPFILFLVLGALYIHKEKTNTDTQRRLRAEIEQNRELAKARLAEADRAVSEAREDLEREKLDAVFDDDGIQRGFIYNEGAFSAFELFNPNLHRRFRKSEDEIIDRLIAANLRWGMLSYSFPEIAKIGQSSEVTSRLASLRVNEEQLTEGLKSPGMSTRLEKTKVSLKMKMILSSDDFKIAPQGSDEQLVGGSEYTEWKWSILPQRTGTLHLKLTAIAEMPSGPRNITTVTRDIVVQVDILDSAKRLVKNNPVTACTAVGASLTAAPFLWKRIRRRIRRRRKHNEPLTLRL